MKNTFTKKDEMHYKIYRYLDILGISEPYLHATQILAEIMTKPTKKSKKK